MIGFFCFFFSLSLLRFTTSAYSFGISNFWPLYCMFFLDSWFTRWVSSTFGHCIVCSFSLCGLPVGYHQPLTIVLYVLSRFVVYPLGIINLWPLHCMFFLGLRFLFTLLVSSDFSPIVHLAEVI